MPVPPPRRQSVGARLRVAATVVMAVVMAVALCAGCAHLPFGRSASPAGGAPVPPSTAGQPGRQLFGVFLGSDAGGVQQMPAFEQFLGGTRLRVGHTYLPGETFSDIEGAEQILDPWAEWHTRYPDDLFVLNVPMAAPNEGEQFATGPRLDDDEVAALLARGAAGEFDRYFQVLAQRLVQRNLADAVLVPGWEMNGITYSHRCAPDPQAWQQYFRRVVAAMRSVPGQRFLFDFNPSRGTDAISWERCYPGDDVVDIIGMDSYDQPPGQSWADYVDQPDGLQAQVDFAAEHGKPVSYPEWGLFRNGDNPEFIRDMYQWMTTHDTVYSTLTDYCPHGVLTCADNPRSAEVVRELFGR